MRASNVVSTGLIQIRGRRSYFLDSMAFCIGLISFYYLNVVGQLYVVEMALPPLLLTLWGSKYRLILEKPIVRVLLFGLVWLMAQIATDLIKGTPWHDMARGWAAICVFLIEFIFVYMLVSKNIHRLYWLLIGTALGGLLQTFVQPWPLFQIYPWKFGFGAPLALLLIAWLGKRYQDQVRVGIIPILLLLSFGALSFFLHARSLGGFVTLTAMLIWFRGTALGRHVVSRRLKPGRLLFLAVVVLTLSSGIISSYEYAVTHGWLGESALKKYEKQAGGEFGLIIGGRADLIPAVFAVIDSPIIGHGSWAKDPRYRKYFLLLSSLGYEDSRATLNYRIEHSDLIPAHSHILQAWVWSGVLGALFWLFILMIVLKAMFYTYRFPNPLFMPVLYLGLTDVWNIFFSPFASEMRFHWALTLTMFIMALKFSWQRSLIARLGYENIHRNDFIQSGPISRAGDIVRTEPGLSGH